MVWLELRTNNTVYNLGWNFSESVWAPTRKGNGSRWPFWGVVNEVVKGDIVFHLRHIDNAKQFLGFSIAATDGYLTHSLPTDDAHEWGFSQEFYKVDLENFQPLEPSVNLSDYFNDNDAALRTHFNNRGNKHLFYTIQNSQLQCLFGAYFSEFNDQLYGMLSERYSFDRDQIVLAGKANTGVTIRELELRIGHQEFSDNVKRNFNHNCCFPNCPVEGKNFLVSGHIARWADNENLRGVTSNGLCLCLMHDKAFERGYFTLDDNFRVVIVNSNFGNRNWLVNLLQLGENSEIKPRQINPSVDALREHWQRIGYEN